MVAHNLPHHMTLFIGRFTEIAEITNRLNDPNCRLLTLVGPGGMGKTRLAIQVAMSSAEQFTGGVYFVALQPLHSSNFLVSTIADVLGLQFNSGSDLKHQLLNYLHDKSILLVLDNLEHLLDGIELLSEILDTGSDIRILATSRERLNLLEEWVFDVQKLNYPVNEAETDIESYDAVQLFLQHSRRLRADFTVTSLHRPAVIRICRLVGGMPLGIEMAASWVRALSCEDIADEIARSLDILNISTRNVEPRHRTMQAVFEPTWTRMADVERDAFMRLSVFRGGFTWEAAKYVAGVSLHILSTLVDRSLVRMDASGRYDLHELLRKYGEEQLEATSTGEQTREAHSAYFADFMRRHEEDQKGRRQIEAIAEIRADFENIRTVWDRAVCDSRADILDQMIGGLWIFCELTNREQDGYALFQYAEEQFAPSRGEVPGQLWGRLLARAPTMEASETGLESALQIAHRYNNPAEIAFCLARLGEVANTKHDYDKAKQMFEQSLTLYQQLGDRYAIAEVLYQLTPRHLAESWDAIKHYREESLRLRREIGDRVGTGWSLAVVALSEGRSGRFAEAERLWLERIAVGQQIGNQRLIAMGHAHVSNKVYFFLGDFAQARASAEQAGKLGNLIGDSAAMGWSLVTLGLLANMDEDYLEGKRLCQQGATTASLAASYADIAALAAWGTAIASCGLGDYEAARKSLSAVLKHIANLLGLVGTVASLVIAAIILAHEGRSTRAVEFLALAFTHPVGAAGWMEKWPLLARLCAELEQALGSGAYSAAWKQGKRMDVEAAVTELKSSSTVLLTSSQKEANQSLDEPLTERELEVLVLIHDGQTNREIADQLFIGVSTVKKHINHIYSKLDVGDRSEAVNSARALHLIS